MIRRLLLPAAVAVAVVLAALPAAPPEPTARAGDGAIAWDVPDDHYLRYTVQWRAGEDKPHYGGGVHGLAFFGWEVEPDGRRVRGPANLNTLGRSLVTLLPEKPLEEPGDKEGVAIVLRPGGARAVRAIGALEHAGTEILGEKTCAVIRGEWRITPDKRSEEPEGGHISYSGRAETTLWFSREDGHMIRGEWKVGGRFTYVNWPDERKPEDKLRIGWARDPELLDLNRSTFMKEVAEAVERGTEHLLGEQTEDGEWTGGQSEGYPMGYNALMTLAVILSDVPADDPRVQKALDHLHSLPHRRTYSTSLYLMALEAAYTPAHEIKNSYNHLDKEVKPAHFLRKLPPEDVERAQKAVDWLVEAGNRNGTWSYPSGTGTGSHDHSNTQYAVLGLHAGARCGAEIDHKVWERILDHFLDAQQKDGPKVEMEQETDGDGTRGVIQARARGWAYTDLGGMSGMRLRLGGERGATGSMTTAGLTAVELARAGLARAEELGRKDRRRARQSIWDGIAWLSENYAVHHNPPAGGWHYYYLYGLERACVLTHQRMLGERDWYREGATLLLLSQRADGGWGNATDTAFALLFLKKATMVYTDPGEHDGDD